MTSVVLASIAGVPQAEGGEAIRTRFEGGSLDSDRPESCSSYFSMSNQPSKDRLNLERVELAGNFRRCSSKRPLPSTCRIASRMSKF